MAEELDDQAAMAQWAAENGPAAMPPAAEGVADGDGRDGCGDADCNFHFSTSVDV